MTYPATAMQSELYKIGEGNIYRPPSEAGSLIIRATIGCSWNKCTFCGMFRDRKFRVCSHDEVAAQIEESKCIHPEVERVFLADGNVLVLSTSRLLAILKMLMDAYPGIKRISAYASPQDVICKTVEELAELKRNGLGLVYVGLESGHDAVLKSVNKGATSSDMVDTARRIKQAGIHLSVIAIAGLGGVELSEQHAVETGKILSMMDPDYIGILTLMLVSGTELADSYLKGRFRPVDEVGILNEIKLMLLNIDVTNCIFRVNHASNYLPLRGTLPGSKQKLISQIDQCIKGGTASIRPEWARGL